MFDEKRRRQDHYEATMAQIYYEHEQAMKELEEKNHEALELGLTQGRSEGLTQGREELILTMLKKGADVQTIAQLTDIPVDKIQTIAKKNLV